MRDEGVGSFAHVTDGTGSDVGMDQLEGTNVVSVSDLQQRRTKMLITEMMGRCEERQQLWMRLMD